MDSFKDKYRFTRDEEVTFIERNMAQLIYTTGKFENLQTTLPQTEDIIHNYTVNGVKPQDVEKVLGLKRAFDFVINKTHPFKSNDVLVINDIIQSGHVDAGQIRHEDVQVPLTNDVWLPPIPQPTVALNDIEKIVTAPNSVTEKAINLNLYLSRWQLFVNGNKRTAIVAANTLMIEAGAGMLAIPENKMHWYGSYLQKFYRSGRIDDIKTWLYDNAVIGTPQHAIDVTRPAKNKTLDKHYQKGLLGSQPRGPQR
ncbi:Fic family protein [Furfurilactobacillus entadae]|uniref:Fic family protein n=1 Tax=Furfurilactobacillus entadae TaxID=2922307 RepID=UPI0035E5459A